MYGSDKYDLVRAGAGVDTVFGCGGRDDLSGGDGPDVEYGGRGDDRMLSDCDTDYWCGQDEKHGGPGKDYFVQQR